MYIHPVKSTRELLVMEERPWIWEDEGGWEENLRTRVADAQWNKDLDAFGPRWYFQTTFCILVFKPHQQLPDPP